LSVLGRLGWRRSHWVRFGVLAVLAVVALVVTIASPDKTRTGPDPNPTGSQAPTSAWSQLPSANDNCRNEAEDDSDGPPDNAMRVLVGNGQLADECAGGELWSPVQQPVLMNPQPGTPGQ
jgi:hypothetical protein